MEALLLNHPVIADCAVVPGEDEEAGEIPVGFVVLKHYSYVNPEAILDYVAKNVAPYKKIRRLKIVDKIPKSPSGKILRRLLKGQAS